MGLLHGPGSPRLVDVDRWAMYISLSARLLSTAGPLWSVYHPPTSVLLPGSRAALLPRTSRSPVLRRVFLPAAGEEHRPGRP
jgi:hypothetical protein